MLRNTKIGSPNYGWVSPEQGGGMYTVNFPLGGRNPFVGNELPIVPINTPVQTNAPLDVVLQTVVTGGNNADTILDNRNCNCLVGTPFIRADGGCGCTSPHIEDIEPTPPVKVPQTITTPVIKTATPVNPNHIEAGVFDGVVNAVRENPVLALAGAGCIAYLLLKK